MDLPIKRKQTLNEKKKQPQESPRKESPRHSGDGAKGNDTLDLDDDLIKIQW